MFLVAWTGLLTLPPVALLGVRDAWLEELGKSGAQENWEKFRREMGTQTGMEGPVQRKVPRSAEPPLRVWLRDRVGLAIAAWLVLGGTLGAFLGLMVAGATAPGPLHRVGPGGQSPNTTAAVPATTTNRITAMPSTPRSENTAGTSGGTGEDDPTSS